MENKAKEETAEEQSSLRESRVEQSETSMLFYCLKLESCYLQSGAIRGNYKEVKDAGERIEKILVELEKLKLNK